MTLRMKQNRRESLLCFAVVNVYVAGSNDRAEFEQSSHSHGSDSMAGVHYPGVYAVQMRSRPVWT
jgi:hypothetical protein